MLNWPFYRGVSSVPFPFWFPFQLHCKLVSSRISSQSVQNILIWCVTWNERPILVLSLLRFSKMTSEQITFNHLRCHSSPTELGIRTGYWRPTWRGTDHPPTSVYVESFLKFINVFIYSWPEEEQTMKKYPPAKYSKLVVTDLWKVLICPIHSLIGVQR